MSATSITACAYKNSFHGNLARQILTIRLLHRDLIFERNKNAILALAPLLVPRYNDRLTQAVRTGVHIVVFSHIPGCPGSF